MQQGGVQQGEPIEGEETLLQVSHVDLGGMEGVNSEGEGRGEKEVWGAVRGGAIVIQEDHVPQSGSQCDNKIIDRRKQRWID